MQRRIACRLILGLLLGSAAACGKPAEPEPIQLPLNRFPGAPKPPKPKEPKSDTKG